MANYVSIVRTNYFHVKDERKFCLLIDSAYGTEDDIFILKSKDEDGNNVFGFCVDGSIAGIPNSCEEQSEEFSYDEFIERLQDCVADDDAIIVLEVGHEKMRYVTGLATVITSKERKTLTLDKLAVKLAQDMLNNPSWETECSY